MISRLANLPVSALERTITFLSFTARVENGLNQGNIYVGDISASKVLKFKRKHLF